MYTKQTWKTGDVITEEKLNHMEDGIANAGGVLIVNDNDGTLDKTWKEINEAFANGTKVLIKTMAANQHTYYEYASACGVSGMEGEYSYDVGSYSTNSENGYPSSSGSGGNL